MDFSLEEGVEYLWTKCVVCKKEFPLKWDTIYGTTGRYYEDGEEAVITCPHCKKEYRY